MRRAVLVAFFGLPTGRAAARTPACPPVRVHFDSDRSDLGPSAKAALDPFVACAAKAGAGRIRVTCGTAPGE